MSILLLDVVVSHLGVVVESDLFLMPHHTSVCATVVCKSLIFTSTVFSDPTCCLQTLRVEVVGAHVDLRFGIGAF